jgi:hypothetical protein
MLVRAAAVLVPDRVRRPLIRRVRASIGRGDGPPYTAPRVPTSSVR